MKQTHYLSGQLLIELMVAITIVTLGILSIIGLLNSSLAINRKLSDRYIATYLGMEGIEIVKNIIDTNILEGGAANWNKGLTTAGSFEADYNSDNLSWVGDLTVNSQKPLLFDSKTGRYGYNSGSPTSFIRTIKIRPAPDGNEIQVNSIVQWSGSQEINLEDHFFNWRP